MFTAIGAHFDSLPGVAHDRPRNHDPGTRNEQVNRPSNLGHRAGHRRPNSPHPGHTGQRRPRLDPTMTNAPRPRRDTARRADDRRHAETTNTRRPDRSNTPHNAPPTGTHETHPHEVRTPRRHADRYDAWRARCTISHPWHTMRDPMRRHDDARKTPHPSHK